MRMPQSLGSQGQLLQGSILKGFPSQSFPPCAGTGSLHSRNRNFVPPPQDTEQEVASIQLDQPPWTAECKNTGKNYDNEYWSAAGPL